MSPLKIQQSLFWMCQSLRLAMIKDGVVDMDTPRPPKDCLDHREVTSCRCGNQFYATRYGNPHGFKLCPNCVEEKLHYNQAKYDRKKARMKREMERANKLR